MSDDLHISDSTLRWVLAGNPRDGGGMNGNCAICGCGVEEQAAMQYPGRGWKHRNPEDCIRAMHRHYDRRIKALEQTLEDVAGKLTS